MAEGLVIIITLGRRYPGWSLSFTGWRIKKYVATLKLNEAGKED